MTVKLFKYIYIVFCLVWCYFLLDDTGRRLKKLELTEIRHYILEWEMHQYIVELQSSVDSQRAGERINRAAVEEVTKKIRDLKSMVGGWSA